VLAIHPLSTSWPILLPPGNIPDLPHRVWRWPAGVRPLHRLHRRLQRQAMPRPWRAERVRVLGLMLAARVLVALVRDAGRAVVRVCARVCVWRGRGGRRRDRTRGLDRSPATICYHLFSLLSLLSLLSTSQSISLCIRLSGGRGFGECPRAVAVSALQSQSRPLTNLPRPSGGSAEPLEESNAALALVLLTGVWFASSSIVVIAPTCCATGTPG